MRMYLTGVAVLVLLAAVGFYRYNTGPSSLPTHVVSLTVREGTAG
jgi:uncharacterized membrane protein